MGDSFNTLTSINKKMAKNLHVALSQIWLIEKILQRIRYFKYFQGFNDSVGNTAHHLQI